MENLSFPDILFSLINRIFIHDYSLAYITLHEKSYMPILSIIFNLTPPLPKSQ